jgi:hypothetical protein
VVTPEQQCKTCKWWGPYLTPHEAWGVCGAILKRNSKATVAVDNAHRKGDLVTRPDFGCVQWEQKES